MTAMVVRAIIAAAIACTACTEAPVRTETSMPSDTGQRQYFCCERVELQFWLGRNCTPVQPKEAAACTELLVCAGDWARAGKHGPLDSPGITTKCRVPE